MRKKPPLDPVLWKALLAANKRVNALQLDIQKPNDPEMYLEVPVIAFDGRDIVWGESSSDFGTMTKIELPIAELTQGWVGSATPQQVGALLFDKDVGQEVTTYLSIAMVFSNAPDDVASRKEVERMSRMVKACVARSITKYVRPLRPSN